MMHLNVVHVYTPYFYPPYGREAKEVNIKYHPGNRNVNSDNLSRCPHTPVSKRELLEDEVELACVKSNGSSISGISIDHLYTHEIIFRRSSATTPSPARSDPVSGGGSFA